MDNYLSSRKEAPQAVIDSNKTSSHLVKEDEIDAFFFRSLERQGIFLNKPQIDAVRHFEGPLLTLAGAGSGKTSVIVCRTGYLIALYKIHPKQILVVTFTRKAAEEMKTRIADLPGLSPGMADQIQASTFHSFFLIILRSYGYQQEILSNERHKQVIIKKILQEMNIRDSYQPETILSFLSSYKMNILSMAEIPDKTPVEKEMKEIFIKYEHWKKENNKMDFDDILLEAYYLLGKTPSLVAALQNRFKFVMVDEFQDTNLLQYELIKIIVNKHNNLFVVGDDDQTIYTFNGARNEFILNFHRVFPSMKIVTLDINYRSTQSIAGLGNEVIRHNKNRKVKTLQATKDNSKYPQYNTPSNTDKEAESIVEQIIDTVSKGKRQYCDYAILHRTASYSRAIFERLVLEKLPFIHYSAGDQNFYEQWITKPVVDHLRLAIDHKNFEAIKGIITTLYINRDMGMEFIYRKESVQPQKCPLNHLTLIPELKEYHVEKINERISLIEKIKGAKPLTAIKWIRDLFYDNFLEANERQRATIHKEYIREMLDELESSSSRFDSIEAFISFVDHMIKTQQEMENLKKDPQANVISLMTIHRAKGLEFPVVYLIGVSEGILPHMSAIEADKMEDMVSDKNRQEKVLEAIEEERRLMYVAITRAMEELYISSPSFYRGKKAVISRFILDVFPPATAKKENAKTKPKEIVLAWQCTSDNCIAWQRIVTYEEVERKEKNCPICNTPMKKEKKELF